MTTEKLNCKGAIANINAMQDAALQASLDAVRVARDAATNAHEIAHNLVREFALWKADIDAAVTKVMP